MKDYEQDNDSSYRKYWDVNNLYGWAMSQTLPVNNFEWIEDTSQFNEDFIKDYNEESQEGYFLENCMKFIMIDHFYLICYTHKKVKTSITSWTSFEKVHRAI